MQSCHSHLNRESLSWSHIPGAFKWSTEALDKVHTNVVWPYAGRKDGNKAFAVQVSSRKQYSPFDAS